MLQQFQDCVCYHYRTDSNVASIDEKKLAALNPELAEMCKKCTNLSRLDLHKMKTMIQSLVFKTCCKAASSKLDSVSEHLANTRFVNKKLFESIKNSIAGIVSSDDIATIKRDICMLKKAIEESIIVHKRQMDEMITQSQDALPESMKQLNRVFKCCLFDKEYVLPIEFEKLKDMGITNWGCVEAEISRFNISFLEIKELVEQTINMCRILSFMDSMLWDIGQLESFCRYITTAFDNIFEYTRKTKLTDDQVRENIYKLCGTACSFSLGVYPFEVFYYDKKGTGVDRFFKFTQDVKNTLLIFEKHFYPQFVSKNSARFHYLPEYQSFVKGMDALISTSKMLLTTIGEIESAVR